MGLRLSLRSEDPAALPESDDASGETYSNPSVSKVYCISVSYLKRDAWEQQRD
jgi:hypothetical protein